MATISKMALEVAKTLHGGPPVIMTYPEAASQSFKAGELVYLVAGKVTICGADPAVILGIAMADASTVTDTDCQVCLATPDIVFSGNLNAGVTAVTHRGGCYGITLASAKWHVDGTKTGATRRLTVIDLDDRDTLGDTSGRLLFVFMSGYLQLQSTS